MFGKLNGLGVGAGKAQFLAYAGHRERTGVNAGGIQTPSFGGFAEALFQRFPGIRGNREFVSLLLDAMKIDRPAYRAFSAFTVREGWPR